MPAAVRRIVILSLGWMFILLGIIGLFLPILQGFLFFGIGLILLSRESEWVRHRIEWACRRWPRFGRMWEKSHTRAHELANRVFHRKRKE